MNRFWRLHSVRPLSLLVATLSVGAGASLLRAETGAAVFQEKCAGCHGADGQGLTDGYPNPLAGDLSMDSLVRLIERTMPEDNPGSCLGDEARQVAEYVFGEFYSFDARLRKGLVSAPHIELVRLTVPQHQNALADLLGQFTPPPRPPREERRERDRDREQPAPEEPLPPAEPGLRGEYYQSKGMSKADERKLERVDAEIEFDYGEGSPAESISADQFAIVWNGSLIAPETGQYEFRVTTANGARLYLNNDASERLRKLRDDSASAGQAALIDAWVSSGAMREQSARVFLLGGRQYPLRLEFFKYKEQTASIKLEWKPPHGTWEVLDDSFLTTAPLTANVCRECPLSGGRSQPGLRTRQCRVGRMASCRK